MPGWTVIHVVETGSTNDDLFALATRQAARDRTVVVADHQSAGRGRLDRRWDAPAGKNLLCSILLDAGNRPQMAQHIVALALIEAAQEVAGVDLALKWPNDVVRVADGGSWSKAAGMLSVLVPDVGVIVGIGVNIGWAPEGGARIVTTDGRDDIAPLTMLSKLLSQIDRLRIMDDVAIIDVYRTALDTIGRRVRVEMSGDQMLEGRAIGVNDDGELIVLEACAMSHTVGVGDVIHLRDG